MNPTGTGVPGPDNSRGNEQSRDDLHGDVDRVVLYRDNAGEWRWRFRAARNAEILADSGQGYTDYLVAWDAAERVTGRLLVQHRPTSPRGDEIQAVVWR